MEYLDFSSSHRPTATMSSQAATHIHVADYLKFRADKEGVGSELSRDWFDALLMVGVRTFFGINTDATGNVLNDIQNPQALREYMTTERVYDHCELRSRDL